MIAALLAVAALGGGGHCTEDQACWSWSTMGNRTRGIVTMHGTPMVVGPCRFARLVRSGDFRYTVQMDGKRYKVGERMRGDQWAIRHGCAST